MMPFVNGSSDRLQTQDQDSLSLTGGFWQASANLYSEEGYKREPEPVASPQSTTLRSTVNTSVKEGGQHLMWTKDYRFKASTVKRSLVTVNEHILIRYIMVIKRGFNHSSYKDVSPVTHSLTCSLF
jgi:hypothetical protein